MTKKKRIRRSYFLLVFVFLGLVTGQSQQSEFIYESDQLKIQALGPQSYLHISNLHTQNYGDVPSNGLIIIAGNEAIVLDSPANESSSLELIKWLQNEKECQIVALVPMHFHEDCVAGLAMFHQNSITSYAYNTTRDILKSNKGIIPVHGFDDYFELDIANEKLILQFIGEGHTRDNIIAYFPKEDLLFGGCLIKAKGAGKGNLEDANIKDWPQTLIKLKKTFPDAKRVVPGHGQPGNIELIDYSIHVLGEH